MHAQALVMVRSKYSAFDGMAGKVVKVRPFDVLVRVADPVAHKVYTLPFGRGELQVVEA